MFDVNTPVCMWGGNYNLKLVGNQIVPAGAKIWYEEGATTRGMFQWMNAGKKKEMLG